MDPMQSINNVDERMTQYKTFNTQLFPSFQVQLIGPLPNLLDPMCQEVKKVHKAYPVQKILAQILI